MNIRFRYWFIKSLPVVAIVIASAALGVSWCTLYREGVRYEEFTKPSVIHTQTKNKLDALNARIQRVEEGASVQPVLSLSPIKELYNEAEFAWIRGETSIAQVLIEKAYEDFPKDIEPPDIEALSVISTSENTVDIMWRTNEPSSSQVEYGSGPNRLTLSDETLSTEHLFNLTGLTPATIYHVKVMSRDEAGNLVVSGEYTFTTPGIPATFTVSNWSMFLSEVDTGKEVILRFFLINTGDLAGSYEVAFTVNGVVEATREVTLDAGAGEELTFTTTKSVAGTYLVGVDGLTISFTVTEETPPPAKEINWWLIAGIIAGVVLLLLILIILLTTRTKEKAKALVSAVVRRIYYRQPLNGE